MRRTALIALLALAGCGGSSLEPLPDVRPVAATASQRAVLTRVVDEFDSAYRRGDGVAACALLTPVAQSYVADSRGASCADALIGRDRPAARPRDILLSLDGTDATIAFADCRLWRLERQGDAWLIDDLGRPRCRPTA
jgi:hypothetical protein